MATGSTESHARQKLSFPFAENSSWRTTGKTTTMLVDEMAEFTKHHDQLSHVHSKNVCTKELTDEMTVYCIHSICNSELVGTLDKDITKALIQPLLKKTSDKMEVPMSREYLETVNLYTAMDYLHTVIREDMKDSNNRYTGLLTVQQICEVHSKLLCGLHIKAGMIRTKEEVYTVRNNDTVHCYPSPYEAEQQLYCLVDQHNLHMVHIPQSSMEEIIAYVYKSATWLMYKFVSTHPFADGNGRMCHLLANYVVSLITPFPVSLHHSPKSGRDDFINALVKCDEDLAGGLGELASLLVEGAWLCWTSLFHNLQLRSPTMSRIIIIHEQKKKTEKQVDQ